MTKQCEQCGASYDVAYASHFATRKFCGQQCKKQSQVRDFTNRVFQKINKTDTCWLWTGTRTTFGYGQIHQSRQPGHLRRGLVAHRVVYELLVGPIPEGLELDHLCRVKHCVNPTHLEPVTTRENIMRSFAKSALNAKKTHCLRGHPLSGDNLYSPPCGGRHCRACRAERDKWPVDKGAA